MIKINNYYQNIYNILNNNFLDGAWCSRANEITDLLDSECMLMGVTVQYSLIFTFECFIDHTTANLDKN